MGNPIVTLASKKEFGRVYCCNCGCIHVQVGPVSLTLSLDDYMHFVDLIHTSAANFELVRSEPDAI